MGDGLYRTGTAWLPDMDGIKKKKKKKGAHD